MNRFFDVVPKAVKVSAPIVMGSFALAGMVAGHMFLGINPADWHMHLVTGAAIGLAGGFIFGAFAAAWMLCLGYVYADARRRGMRPVLWTLIAALFPHLFGFLLYFALRQPMTPKCPHCGQPMMLDQRFCSWCGSAASAGGGAGASGMGPLQTV